MKKMILFTILAIAPMVACDKEVSTEDESAGTRAAEDSANAEGSITFVADTAWTDTIFVDF